MLLYADGVTKAGDSKGELYGVKRLCQIVTRSRSLPAQVIMKLILEDMEDINQFSRIQARADDITMIVLLFLRLNNI